MAKRANGERSIYPQRIGRWAAAIAQVDETATGSETRLQGG